MMADHKAGTCRWCRDKTDVWHDTLLCDDCDSNTVHCRICRARVHYESKCRHVFQDNEFEWRGAGVNPSDDEMKRPFHRLLSAMGEEFAIDLKAAIKSGKFFTWMVAPMIGGGGILEVNGMPARDGKRMVTAWGDRLIELGESRRAEELHDGYSWLVSLYKGNTRVANRTTIGWIDNWLWPFTPVAVKRSAR
jgi:hypothetical protein